ncbi:GGDEF domain-containing protein [Acidiferrimicrobium sp. IK]|uniref:GGDEF domain-containing protein n=1 Tax=Acidiferrimicrobium sp. IK TaxID=2871700 RepID=UPI0021CB2A77|nr:sensor domain-containing diguanylate cyclase [Acidiferrimicrobium sp. IK]MCU4183342.1 GGDEF domain-containing protein [Acidiferrimicrobium sp. IK]
MSADVVLAKADAAVIVVDSDLQVRWATPAAQRLFGADVGAFPDLVDPGDAAAVAGFLGGVMSGPGGPARMACAIPVPDGAPRRVELVARDLRDTDGVRGIAVVASDVTGWAEREAGLQDQMRLDDLTGLANRTAIVGSLEQAARSAARTGPGPALLYLDLDSFKAVNDAYGHRTGDHVLRMVGSRLARAVGAAGTVARIGGDEFNILLDRTTPAEALGLAETALAVIAEPLATNSGTVTVTASIGVAMIAGAAAAWEALHHADVAMYRAKQLGRGQAVLHSVELDDWALARKHDLERLAAQVETLEAEKAALAHAARIDDRTGLPNGATFDADHARYHARHARDGEPYALALIDIDHFHAYNARYHYLAGHSALARVAAAIAGSIRRSDRAYRYGGEEFTVLLSGASGDEAALLAERIRAAVEALQIEHTGNDAGVVTVSIGVLDVTAGHASPADVLEDANVLLLEAKHAGRNRVRAPER